MAVIFLSYSREDGGYTPVLVRVLEAAGHEVWWDRHIDSGEEFAARIEAALDKADIVLVAWSKQSVKSRWVRDEAAVGADTGRLVPVSVDGALPPMGFRQFQTLDLTGWKGTNKEARTTELLGSIARRLEANGTAGPASRAIEPKRRFAWAEGKRAWGIGAALVLVLAAAIFALIRLQEPQVGPLKPTIALVPFTTASPDGELRELASQTRDAIAHSFSQSGLPLRLADTVAENGGPAIDFKISGDLSRKADKLVATIRLDEVAHGVTVFSHRFEAGPEDARDLPERIGAQMAGNLTWSDPLMALDRRRPIEPSLLATLLQGSDFTAGLDNLQQYQNLKRVAAKAPDLQVAQIGVAFTTAFVLSLLPREERGEAVAQARRAAERAIALDPGVGDIYATWCLLGSETRMAECEDRLRAGRRIDPDAAFLNTFLSHRMRDVGRFDESVELARLAHAHDVYVPTKIAWMLKSSEYAGDSGGARQLYQQGSRWWPEFKPMFFRNRVFGLIERGDFAAIQRLELELGAKNLPSDYQSIAPLVAALKSRSIAAAMRACPDTDAYLLNMRCMLALASLGDQDGAYAIGDKLYPRRVGRTPSETERIWLDEPDGAGALGFITSPAAAPMRRDPRYLQLAQRVGLLAYWRSGRAPDFCRKQPEPICAQLLKRN